MWKTEESFGMELMAWVKLIHRVTCKSGQFMDVQRLRRTERQRWDSLANRPAVSTTQFRSKTWKMCEDLQQQVLREHPSLVNHDIWSKFGGVSRFSVFPPQSVCLFSERLMSCKGRHPKKSGLCLNLVKYSEDFFPLTFPSLLEQPWSAIIYILCKRCTWDKKDLLY